ncbi:MAG: hypothetical protein MPN21_16450 [Thermoanaerobaculia bacterium]|nr:hypothetical protein [Thermoanaerobaculia bacterium]
MGDRRLPRLWGPSGRLRRHSRQVEVWTTTYEQILGGEQPLYRFVETTGLRPVRDALRGADRNRFESEFRKRLVTFYPQETNGTTLFRFRRLFIVATKNGANPA